MPLRCRTALRPRAAFLLALMLDVSCRAATEPSFPSNAVRFDPPPVYQLWWNVVESCSGAHGDFSSVKFYEEPGQMTATAGSESANAYWFASGDRIVVGGLNEFDGPVIRHEMLHALLGPNPGGNGHPHAYFAQRCGGIVHCEGTCLTDDGPLPVTDPSAPVVSPSVLDVSVSVQPTPFDPSLYGGWMAVLVTARNPASHAVWVKIPADQGTPTTFGYEIGARAVDAVAAADTAVAFQAGETRQQLFDVLVAPGMVQLAPGRYDVRGFFANDTTAPDPLVVVGTP